MSIIKHIIKNNHYLIPVTLLAVAVAALSAAYIAEYGFGLLPCVLCLYQRIPFAVVIALSLLALLLPERINITKLLLLLCGLAFLIGAGIAAFHVGVEQGWWQGTDKCSGAGIAKSAEELKNIIMQAPVIRCDEPQFWFLRLTMAAWNVIFSGFLACASFWIFINLRIAKS